MDKNETLIELKETLELIQCTLDRYKDYDGNVHKAKDNALLAARISLNNALTTLQKTEVSVTYTEESHLFNLNDIGLTNLENKLKAGYTVNNLTCIKQEDSSVAAKVLVVFYKPILQTIQAGLD